MELVSIYEYLHSVLWQSLVPQPRSKGGSRLGCWSSHAKETSCTTPSSKEGQTSQPSNSILNCGLPKDNSQGRSSRKETHKSSWGWNWKWNWSCNACLSIKAGQSVRGHHWTAYISPARCQAKLDIASFWCTWLCGWSFPNIEAINLNHCHLQVCILWFIS